MKYRPEYHLDRLRMRMGEAEGEQQLQLRWLRTMVVDLSHTPLSDVDERLAHQQRGPCAVERVICKEFNDGDFPLLLPFLTQSVPMLTSLDLRGCFMDDDCLLAVADAHCLSLRRLCLPIFCSVTQSTLDRFTQLEGLDATGCRNLTNVDFCCATLRVLYANACRNLTDAGLRNATRLEVLHVKNCEQVTDVSPFDHCLLELDASCRCGIGSAALSDCRRLQVLKTFYNDEITTLQPFAQGLRELNAENSVLNDAALADVTGLVSLWACGNRAITTVGPFGASLRRLDASHSLIGDAGLVTATNLVYLNASSNSHICSLAAFSTSLLELDVTCDSQGIDDAALSAVTKLIWLDVGNSGTITTLQSCGSSLRHLSAWNSAHTNEGLSTATQLVTLYSPNLTTIEPFLHSLEELITDSTAMLRTVVDALQLRLVKCSFGDLIDTDLLLVAAGFSKCGDGTWCRTV